MVVQELYFVCDDYGEVAEEAGVTSIKHSSKGTDAHITSSIIFVLTTS